MDKESKTLYLLLAAISSVAISGSLLYYFYSLNRLGIFLTLILSFSGLFYFWRILKKETGKGKNQEKLTWKKHFWTLPYFFFFIFCLIFLLRARTSLALSSPWQIISEKFFIAYALATVSLILAAFKKIKSLFLLSLHYFLTFSVLLFVFKLGFGYDPFIHQASLELINKQGYIEPKQFLYLGQYSIEIIAHKILFIPLDWLNNFFVPLLAATTLPLAIKNFLLRQSPTANWLLPILALLILPFSIFTISVPQNLAYLFLILSLFIGLAEKNKTGLIMAWLLSLAAFFCHPLAGIPALAWAAGLTAQKILKGKLKIIIISLICVGLSTALPLALYISQLGQAKGNDAPLPAKISKLFWGFSRQENIILNFVNFFSYHQNIWLSAIFLAGLIFIFIKRKMSSGLVLTGSLALSLLGAFLATKYFVDFNTLISYERGDYLIRLLTETFIFILPAATCLFSAVIEKTLQQNRFKRLAWAIFLILLITTSLYCSYPRRDSYFNSRSFSVGRSDFEAVKWVENDAGEEPYAVLANQQVSVAALKTFGFGRYFQNYEEVKNWQDINVYFYPIPTGGPLYRVYLDMVYNKASKETAKKASQITGAKTIYFVLNRYWWAFDKIVEEAKIGADTSIMLPNGNIAIFKYSFN